MSGTSLDGLDIAFCHFEKTEIGWGFEIERAETIGYPAAMLDRLKNSKESSAEGLAKLDTDYGRWMGEVVHNFIAIENIKPEFVASHGYTVFHQPENGFTLQIGNGFEVHRACNKPVIYNFRQLDVALGGQGAPLVPIGDLELFRDYKFCLNLGGFANISVKVGQQIVAGDICPFNLVLNELANQLDRPYDENGNLSGAGEMNQSLINKLDELEYYGSDFPKSLGTEWLEQKVEPIIDSGNLSIQDKMCSFVHHAAKQTAKVIYSYNPNDTAKVLCTGGGAYNSYFVETLKKYIPENIQIVIPEANIIEFKEALIFAFLGVLKLRGEINTLASVTGASSDSSGGLIVK